MDLLSAAEARTLWARHCRTEVKQKWSSDSVSRKLAVRRGSETSSQEHLALTVNSVELCTSHEPSQGDNAVHTCPVVAEEVA